MKPYFESAGVTLWHGDALETLRQLPDDSIDAVITDPPYFRVKGEAWDNAWDNPAAFLDWMGQLCQQWQRVLKPNGSLYVFASPKMAARVEVKIGETFNILNRIRWVKADGWHKKADKEELRSFLSPWEEIIFAEHFGADNSAKGEAGYVAKCDDLRGFVFEPLRAYLDSELKRAGLTVQDVAEAWRIKTGNANRTGMAGHWFSEVQWTLPTAENYEWLRGTLSQLNSGGQYLCRDYEDLRQEYEDLRRPFTVSPDVPYTDVWDFPTVPTGTGKHICEKPFALAAHIISASTRPRAVVLDCFVGSGVFGEAAVALGRQFVGIEKDPYWCAAAARRIGRVTSGDWQAMPMQPALEISLFASDPLPEPARQLSLLGES